MWRGGKPFLPTSSPAPLTATSIGAVPRRQRPRGYDAADLTDRSLADDVEGIKDVSVGSEAHAGHAM